MDILPTMITLKDGSSVSIGPMSPCDKNCLLEAFEQLSDRSRYSRFHSPMRSLPDTYLDYLIHSDNVDNVVIAAETLVADKHIGIGLARYVRLPEEPGVAEFSITVIDAYQNLGLGSLLLEKLAEHANQNQVLILRGYVLSSNEPMIRMLKRFGAVCRRDGSDSFCFEFDPVPVRAQETTSV